MTCKKKSFATKEEAVLRVNEIIKEGTGDRKPIRSYQCPTCGNFHLTSWSKRQKLEVNRKTLEFQVEYYMKKKGWSYE